MFITLLFKDSRIIVSFYEIHVGYLEYIFFLGVDDEKRPLTSVKQYQWNCL